MNLLSRNGRRLMFDKFSEWVADKVAGARFFAFCVLLILVWAPSFLVLPDIDTWQLIINTATTIITFLLVALLHNEQHRNESAMNRKLDAQTKALLRNVHPADTELAVELRETLGAEKADS